VLLVVGPWTAWWSQNFFARAVPWLGDWMASGFVRGGVTGVGLLTTGAGLRDLTALFVGRTTSESPSSFGDSR
jgi:hypothetical protein